MGDARRAGRPNVIFVGTRAAYVARAVPRFDSLIPAFTPPPRGFQTVHCHTWLPVACQRPSATAHRCRCCRRGVPMSHRLWRERASWRSAPTRPGERPSAPGTRGRPPPGLVGKPRKPPPLHQQPAGRSREAAAWDTRAPAAPVATPAGSAASGCLTGASMPNGISAASARAARAAPVAAMADVDSSLKKSSITTRDHVGGTSATCGSPLRMRRVRPVLGGILLPVCHAAAGVRRAAGVSAAPPPRRQ